MVAFFKFASESGPLSSMFVAQQFRFTALTIFLPKSSFHVFAIFFVVRPVRFAFFFQFASVGVPNPSHRVTHVFRFTALMIFSPKSSFHVFAIFFVVRPARWGPARFVCGMAFGACHSSDCLEHSQRGAQQYKRTHFLCN
jgi:hypothetical protein